jgi:hypothetical protein
MNSATGLEYSDYSLFEKGLIEKDFWFLRISQKRLAHAVGTEKIIVELRRIYSQLPCIIESVNI